LCVAAFLAAEFLSIISVQQKTTSIPHTTGEQLRTRKREIFAGSRQAVCVMYSMIMEVTVRRILEAVR
jgi:hypothetical protein